MIDLHTHILPFVDDGARNTEEALELTELLYRQGVYTAVCTPHFDPSLMALEEFVDRRAKAMSYMTSSRVSLIPASETSLNEYLFHYDSLEDLTIGNTNLLLLELPCCKKWNNGIYRTLENLIGHFDIIPIIAHIERYPAIRKRHIKNLKKMGCIIQLNTSSLLEKKLERKALAYIKDGLIDVLGSDCHNLKHRPPQIQMALEKIRNKLGNSYCEALIEQTERILQGFDIRRTNETDANIMY